MNPTPVLTFLFFFAVTTSILKRHNSGNDKTAN